MRFFVRIRRRSRAPGRKKPLDVAHYRIHKKAARAFIEERIAALNQQYGFEFVSIAIRNQRSRWGSCSARKILNFNYRLLFLPPHLADYVIVHELCHLAEMNHSSRFWEKVAATIPDYRAHRGELQKIPISKAISHAIQRT